MTKPKNQRTAQMERRMAEVLEVWLANPMLSLTEVAEKAEISDRQFARYRENENFMAEYDRRCKEKFKALQAKALETMEILMEEGHFQASKYVLDGNDYGAKQKVEVSTPTTIKISINDKE